MPASGYKLFATGDVLTAADVNNYLMLQTVMVFANAAARTSALSGVLAEGLVSYLKDTDVVEVYTGAAWVSLDDPNAVQNSGYYAAGKNAIINGAMAVWQRGTTFTNPTGPSFNADRWEMNWDGTGTTRVLSRQTFTPGAAPVAGYESQFYFNYNMTVAGTNTANDFWQTIEDVRIFAGQTVTFSFYAKSSIARSITGTYYQIFGSGGSGMVTTTAGSASVTTGWARYTMSFAVPSISGKTVGTNSYGQITLGIGNTLGDFSLWGLQLEVGSTATSFQTASGTIGGELALCQRYYQRFTASGVYSPLTIGQAISATGAIVTLPTKVTMRSVPSITNSNYALSDSVFITTRTISSFSDYYSTTSLAALNIIASGGLTAGNATTMYANNNASAYLELSSEL